MASLPYLVIGPTGILSFIGLLIGPDKTIPTPAADWHHAVVDLLIPAKNEEENIVYALSSIFTQTMQPRNIFLVDDNSSDKTRQLAKEFSEKVNLNVTIIHNTISQGKTYALKKIAHDSDADVIVVLDADTVFRSENYIERLVQELYQGVGISSACGVALPFLKRDRERLLKIPEVGAIAEKNPKLKRHLHLSTFDTILQTISNSYREELYLFLEKFIYHAEMVFFGTIINTVGCAVAYRRKYLKSVFDEYEDVLGVSLTTAEDMFIGFSFINSGYRNIQVNTVYALTQEPLVSAIPKQTYYWSSSFLQCCYYFGDLLFTPFKIHRVLRRWIWEKTSKQFQEIQQKRKIKEAYRQAFGAKYTEQYGRPIGWFIFFAAVEKVTYAFTIVAMMIIGLWDYLLITYVLEVILFSLLIAIFHQNKKTLHFFRSIIISPVRYVFLFYDFYILGRFYYDLLCSRELAWKK